MKYSRSAYEYLITKRGSFTFLPIFLFLVSFFSLLTPGTAFAATYVPESPLTSSAWQACGTITLQNVATLNQGYNQGREQVHVDGPGIDPSTCRERRDNGLITWAQGPCLSDGRCNYFTSSTAFNGRDSYAQSSSAINPSGASYNSDTGMPTQSVNSIPHSDWRCVNPTHPTTGDDGQLHSTTECTAAGTDLHWKEDCHVDTNGTKLDCRVLYGDTFNNQATNDWYPADGTGVTLQNPSSGEAAFQQDNQDIGSHRVGWVESFFQGLGDISLRLVAAVIFFVTEILIWALLGLLAIISWLFDAITSEFVMGMGKYITSTDANAIRGAWVMIRDLANIGIIGGLVAIAIGTIIGSEKNGIQKNLARLLIGALLINFSYFFAGAIIDFSNYVARESYYSILGNCPHNSVVNTFGCGPASQLISAIQLSKFTSGASAATAANTGNAAAQIGGAGSQQAPVGHDNHSQSESISISRLTTYNVMEMIFIILLSFVFLSAISLLVARFVALVFLLITSPIGIAGMAVPLLKQYSDEWWKALWSQTMFAPVFFVLLSIAINIIRQFAGTFQAGATAVAAAGGGVQSTIGIIAMFTIAIGFVWAALSTAQSMSKEATRFGALYKAAETGLGWVPKAYTGLLKTGSAIAYRQTIGQFGERAGLAYADWAAKHDVANKGIPLPFTNGKGRLPFSKLISEPLDRAIQERLDKARDAKVFKKPSFDDIRKARDARQVELDKRKEDGDNKEKALRRNAMKEFVKRRNELRKKKDAAGSKWDENSEDGKELKRMEAFELARKEQKDLEAKRQRLEALRKEKPLTKAQNKELAATKQKLDDSRKLHDEFGIGGAIGKRDRAYERHLEAKREGVEKVRVNEIERKKELQDKEGNGTVAPKDEDEYKKLLAREHLTGDGALSEPERDQLINYQKKIASWEKQELTEYKDRERGLSEKDQAELDRISNIPPVFRSDKEKKKFDRLTKKKDDTQKQRQLTDDALEGDGHFAGRQLTRWDGLGRKMKLVTPKGGGTPKWVLDEGEAAYGERLDLDKKIGFREARTEGETIMTNFSEDFMEREYRKKHDSIVPYAKLLPDNEWLKIAKNHNIREEIRNEMWEKRRQPWTQQIIDVTDRVARGQLVVGSPEWKDALLSPYNEQGRTFNNHDEFVEMLKSNGIAGHSQFDDKGERIKKPDGSFLTSPEDLQKYGRPIKFRELMGAEQREQLWNGTFTGAFEAAKKAGVLPKTAQRDARTAKTINYEKSRNEIAAGLIQAGLDEDPDFTTKEEGTVDYVAQEKVDKLVSKNLDAGPKARGTAAKVAAAYNAAPNHNDISEETNRYANEETRWAKLQQGGSKNSPLKTRMDAAVSKPIPDDQRMAIVANAVGKPVGSQEHTAALAIMGSGDEAAVATAMGYKPGTAEFASVAASVTPEDIAAYKRFNSYTAGRTDIRARMQAGEFNDEDGNLDTGMMSDEEFALYRANKAAEEMGKNHDGKNDEEPGYIFNKKMLHSVGVVEGIKLQQFVNIAAGQDKAETDALIQNALKFGDEALLRGIFTNPNIKDKFDYPPVAKMRKINLIRAASVPPKKPWPLRDPGLLAPNDNEGDDE